MAFLALTDYSINANHSNLNIKWGGVSELCVIKQESERQIERERESWHWFPCQLLLLNTKHSLNNSLGSHGAINEAVIAALGQVPSLSQRLHVIYHSALHYSRLSHGAHLRACLRLALNAKRTNILFTRSPTVIQSSIFPSLLLFQRVLMS